MVLPDDKAAEVDPIEEDIRESKPDDSTKEALSSPVKEWYERKISQLEEENRRLRKEVQVGAEKISSLESRVLSTDLIKGDDDLTKFYTGFPSYPMFMACFNFLKDSAAVMRYWQGSRTTEEDQPRLSQKPGPKRVLPLIEELCLFFFVFVFVFLVMVRLRLGLPAMDLGHRFGIKASTMSRIFITWVNLMDRMFRIQKNMAFQMEGR